MAFWRRRPSFELPDDWEDVVARRSPTWWDLPIEVRTTVRDRMLPLLDGQRWEASRGFDLSGEAQLVIASQAALLLVGLPIDRYPNVESIIVHPSTMLSDEERQGPVPGVMSDDVVELAGEAGHGHGPVVLAWDEVVWDLRHPRRGRNVVVHEFAHKLDMLDQVVDGTPPLLPEELFERWVEVCTAIYDEIRDGEGSPVLDDYAGEDPGEFFAVASETFIADPARLRTHHRDLYDLLVALYGRDPAGEAGPGAEPS